MRGHLLWYTSFIFFVNFSDVADDVVMVERFAQIAQSCAKCNKAKNVRIPP